MDIKPIRVTTAVTLGATAIALAVAVAPQAMAPQAMAAPSPLPAICIVAGQAVPCPRSAPPAISTFPGAVHPYPYGYLPAPIASHR